MDKNRRVRIEGLGGGVEAEGEEVEGEIGCGLSKPKSNL